MSNAMDPNAGAIAKRYREMFDDEQLDDGRIVVRPASAGVAVVVLSGGMDSATLLAWALREGFKVHTLSVFYGQRHSRELESAQLVAQHYGVPNTIVGLSALARVMRGSSQTDDVEVPEGHYADESMRKTVVPNRNMILLSVAAAHAISVGAGAIFYGAHAGDHAIYPDCRSEFVVALDAALKTCHYSPLYLHAPFLGWNKGAIARYGLQVGVPYGLTWTCYKGGDLHCGKCGSCVERREAFHDAGAVDPVAYEA